MYRKPLAFLAALAAFAPAVFGQSEATAPADEPVYDLSPFAVNATGDVGYLASSTLSGSRIDTQLRDVAASVTVLTDEFMNDLGADDIASALALVAGAENDSTTDSNQTNSLNQGYVGGDFGDPNNRTGEVRVRGLGRASNAADFIQIITAPDRYNVERAEFLRGANSILFGLAEPAGLVNYTSKSAKLYKDFGQLQLKVDNYGSMRGVLDYNQVLVKNALAVRFAALNSKTEYQVKTAQQYDRRYYLTGTYKPFKNTTIRASFEDVNRDGRRPNYRVPQDNVSDWLSLYNTYYDKLSPADLAAAFYWDPSLPGGGAQGTNGVPKSSVVTVDGQSTNIGIIRRVLDGNNKATAVFYDDSSWTDPLFGGALVLGKRNPNGADVSPANTRGFFARTAGVNENTTGYVDRQVTDSGIFPLKDYELSALPGSFQKEDATRYNVTVEQKVNRDLYLFATFQREENTRDNLFSPIAQTHAVNLDINTKLPDGRDNPNFLRPFVVGRSLGGWTNEEATNFLFQGNYDLDFSRIRDNLDWLGFHRITGLYSSTNLDRLAYRYGIHVDNTVAGVMEGNQDHAMRHLYQVWYVGDAVQPGDTALRWTGLPALTDAHVDNSYPVTYYNTTTKVWEQAPEEISVSRLLIRNQRSHTELDNSGYGISLQSFFWNRRIVTLFGYRRDSVKSYIYDLITQDPPFLGTTRDDYIKDDVAPDYEDEQATTTQSIVFHVTDWFRVYANRSENFAATAPRSDNLFRPIEPQNGETIEFGVGLSLMEDKLNLRIVRYESSQYAATNAGGSSTASLRIDAFEDNLYTALQNANRLDEWQTISADGPSNLPYDEPLNVAATEDSISKGWEVELVYNPTPNWRIALNVSQTDNRSSNIAGEIKDFIDARAAYYKPFFDEGLRADGTNNATPDNAGNTSMLLRQQFINAIASNYLGNIVAEGTSNPGVSEYTVGLVTKYSFQDGWLDGFSVGGSLRWESGKILGYGQREVLFNLGGLVDQPGFVSDPDQPYESDAIWLGSAFIGYKRDLMQGRIKWDVQLNVQNMTSEGSLRVIRYNPDQTPVWGVSRELTYVLSSTFRF